MNAKRTIPLIASLAPPLLVGVAAYYGFKWLFSPDDTEKKQENNSLPTITNSVPVPLTFPPVFISPKSKPPAQSSFVPIQNNLTEILPAQKRRLILRKHLAFIFQDGARSLYRVDAVAALRKLGFSKAAAYEVLSPARRFTRWLQIAPDGMISWQG
jgi:hypothetical protein